MDFSQFLSLDEMTTAVSGFLPKLLSATIVFAVFWLALKLIRPPIRRMLSRAGIHETLIRMIVDNVLAPTVYVIALVTAASHLGVNVTAALTGMGVVGVALGIAAQDTVANMISGFLIFWDKPFQVGDFVTVADQYGSVMEITMRSTRIRTRQNTFVVIPNKNIIDHVLVNHTKHGAVRVEVMIGIAYKESIPEARRVILEAVSDEPDVLETPAPDVVVSTLGSSSVDLLVRVWIGDSKLERNVYYRTIEVAKLALDRAGIQIPYHHLQLFVDDVEERVWKKAARHLLAAAAPRGDAA